MTWISAGFENNNGLVILVLIDKLNLMAYRRPFEIHFPGAM